MRLLALVALALCAPARAADPVADVRHDPLQPKPGATVLVTARLGAGVTKPVLKVQLVAPGGYVRKTDAEYEKNWAELPMRDDGKDGDAKAGDGTFTARVPAEYQKHRHLIRYRVFATDAAGKAVRAPAADAPSPNFAWWCDAGPADYVGSREPGKAPAVKFDAAFLNTLQAIHLVARGDDVAKSQWDHTAHKQRQQGTVVYRGIVYDHIQYSNRGQGSAHIAGKNKWALKFTGREVPFVDHDGVPFPAPVDSLDLNPGGSTPYVPVHRGIAGLDEVLCMRAYRLAGVPTPPATWVQWRVVTSAEEVNAKDQYAGDLWGLYVAIGEMDPKLMADAKLPDGIAVSTQSGLKHVPKDATGMKNAEAAQKTWEQFINGVRGNQKEEWWRANLDVRAYASFHALNRLIGNVDLRPDGNHGYYRHPDGHWAPIPWDMDMTFVPRHHQPGYVEAIRCTQHPAIATDVRNRAREILDLFASDASPTGGQVGQMVADLGSALTPKGHAVDWPRLDEARWNFSPRINPKGAYFVNPASADHFGGRWTRKLATPDFAGFQKYLVDFCTDSRPGGKYAPNDGNPTGYGFGYLAHEAKDAHIPAKATVARKGDTFAFEASAFASPAGAKAAALEWRVGRVGARGAYELTDHWRQDVATGRAAEVPAAVFKAAGEYRVRARWRDDAGRCGHWSAPVAVTVK